jgi:methylated-DNA-[protein]-cysteine S-methyltransferase
VVELLECADVPTPIGTFRIVYTGRSVRVVDLLERGLEQTGVPDGVRIRRPPFPVGSPPRQLSEYFRGKRTTFDLEPEPPQGSTFDAAVWAALCQVPAGETVTYGELARRAGHPGSARAVGGSMHRNPIPIIIPCHRVVGESGSLTGFGLGLWRKRWLLDKEGAWPLRSGTPEGPSDPAQRTLDARAPRGPRSP